MSAYFLTCSCGKKVAVDAGQAGGRATCTCGQQLDVPTLRNLRHLPRAEPEAGKSRPTAGAAWNMKKGFVAAGLIIAGLLTAYALWNRFTEPAVPKFDAKYRSQKVNEGVERLTPLDAWNLWVEHYRPMADRGFEVFQHPHQTAIEDHVASRRMLQATLLITAGVIVAVSLTIAFLWRQ